MNKQIEIFPFAPPAEPRPWLSTVCDILSVNYIATMFGVTIRTVQRWIAQRPYVSEESVRENPIEHFERILKRLINDGYTDIARAIISRFANIAGCNLINCVHVKPDKDHVEAEMLDDYPSLVEFHESIKKGANIDTIRFRAQKLFEEIEETIESYKLQKK
jgi:hypothetical protein